MPNPPTPTALKVLRGNPSHRPLPANEPMPQGPAHKPATLSPAAAEHWDEVAPVLEACGLLTAADAPAFAAYCETHALWRQAMDDVAATGLIVLSRHGPKVNPSVNLAEKLSRTMRAYLSDFGMNPVSRSRVSAAPVQEETNPFAALTLK